jgi:hypothetical protein
VGQLLILPVNFHLNFGRDTGHQSKSLRGSIMGFLASSVGNTWHMDLDDRLMLLGYFFGKRGSSGLAGLLDNSIVWAFPCRFLVPFSPKTLANTVHATYSSSLETRLCLLVVVTSKDRFFVGDKPSAGRCHD